MNVPISENVKYSVTLLIAANSQSRQLQQQKKGPMPFCLFNFAKVAFFDVNLTLKSFNNERSTVIYPTRSPTISIKRRKKVFADIR
jgi:hypothetical protein